MRLSELHPILYRSRIAQKRTFRLIGDLTRRTKFASVFEQDDLEFSCKRHQSLLRRRLGNSDPELQENKVVNLGIASPKIDGVLIRPGETFSFWRLVGEATATRGYLEGMQLSRGEVVRGVGGGLCQLSNLLFWMALHTPLVVSERHHHSFDPFPDENRVLPFGSGCGVFYNYIDLRFFNPTDITFQLRVHVGEKHLKGAIYSNLETPHSYHIIEKNHRFTAKNGRNFRENEIWRNVVDRRSGRHLTDELLVRNHAEVKYELNIDAATCTL